jgi:Flp pilus assembly protein TadD
MAHMMRGVGPAAASTHSFKRGVRLAAGFSCLAATLMLGACAETADMLPKATSALADDSAKDPQKPEVSQNELQKATTYWGQKYSEKPSELQPALNYAKNLKALGEKNKAIAVLQQAMSLHDGDKDLANEYGRLALEMGQVNVAARMLEVADDPAKPDWRVVSARGTVLAKQGQYKQAIPFYERALTLKQNQPSVLNNLAMAYAMSGEAKKAEDMLRQASAGNAGENTDKVKQNLALVLGLQGRYDEAKSVTAGMAVASVGNENVDMLRSVIKVKPTASSTALASGEVPDFKTKVKRAIATAEPAPFTEPGIGTPDAMQRAIKDVAAPVFKAAATDAPLSAQERWNANVTAKTAAAETVIQQTSPAQPAAQPASGSSLKGSSQ